MNRIRTLLFLVELRVRGRFALDCSGCLQRELDQSGRFPILPRGKYRLTQTLQL
jgi:hypothetical protein